MSENGKASNIVEDIVERHARKTAMTVITATIMSSIISTCALAFLLGHGYRSQEPVAEAVSQSVSSESRITPFTTKHKLIGYINAVMSKPLADDPLAMDFAFGLLHHRPDEAWGLTNDKRIELDIQQFQDTETLLDSFRHYAALLKVEPSMARWAEESVLAELAKDVSGSKDKVALLTQTSGFIDIWTTYYHALPATDDQRDAKTLYAQRAKDKILSRLDSSRM